MAGSMKGAVVRAVLLMLKTLHDLSTRYYHDSQDMKYVGSSKVFSIHRSGLGFFKHAILLIATDVQAHDAILGEGH